VTVAALIAGRLVGSPELRQTADGRAITIAAEEATMGPSDEILQHWHRLPPIGVAWLLRLKELGISVDALSEPELPVQAKVVLRGDTFEFDDGKLASDALVFLVRDDNGEPADFVAWAPKSDRLSSWWGIPMLGMKFLSEPRLDPDGALAVFTDPIEWLIAERNGLLVVSFVNAAHLLRAAAPLRASSAKEANRVRNLITAAPPRVHAPLGSTIPVPA
jgi:hypothetical protein